MIYFRNFNVKTNGMSKGVGGYSSNFVIPVVRDGNFAPPHPAPCRFSLPRKGGGVRMGQYFVPAPQGRVGMNLVFLSPTRPAPPRPHPALIKTIIVNLVNSKSLIFKVKHKSTRYEIKYFLF